MPKMTNLLMPAYISSPGGVAAANPNQMVHPIRDNNGLTKLVARRCLAQVGISSYLVIDGVHSPLLTARELASGIGITITWELSQNYAKDD